MPDKKERGRVKLASVQTFNFGSRELGLKHWLCSTGAFSPAGVRPVDLRQPLLKSLVLLPGITLLPLFIYRVYLEMGQHRISAC